MFTQIIQNPSPCNRHDRADVRGDGDFSAPCDIHSDYPILIDAYSMEFSCLFFINGIFLSLNIVLILACTVDPDEMPSCVAFF